MDMKDFSFGDVVSIIQKGEEILSNVIFVDFFEDTDTLSFMTDNMKLEDYTLKPPYSIQLNKKMKFIEQDTIELFQEAEKAIKSQSEVLINENASLKSRLENMNKMLQICEAKRKALITSVNTCRELSGLQNKLFTEALN